MRVEPLTPVRTNPLRTRVVVFLLMLAGTSLWWSQPAHASGDQQLCAPSSNAGGVATRRATLAGVPAILRMPAHTTRPPIILWHGFGPPASAAAIMEALPLDEVAAVKVYLDLPMFGERAPAGGTKELARRQAKDVGLEVFEPIVVGAADELPRVVQALEQQGCAKRADAIGLVGFSAGGAAALYAMSQREQPVDAAVLINPSTGLTASVQAFEQATGHHYAWSPASRALARQTDAAGHAAEIAGTVPPPALLFLQGADDTVMDSRSMTELDASLQKFYRRSEQRLKVTRLPGVSHQWAADPQALASVRQAVAAWFNAY
ncbi:hypothetical protein DVT68_11735 [Dyella solisilvae]|uniref:Peptidase S9 prolyl oligopeptidase catalytic domain-containing protein n=1 Tax=Dyella solisilvae TaxID=1920168 RepID=A0A370KAU4_9GAMM|nr:prolyl oligopeptidase family serine peptidase [Dyella solisilvae]RDI99140.1 hypothetical protein DVT68_11735 [Dyella solisilvae]